MDPDACLNKIRSLKQLINDATECAEQDTSIMNRRVARLADELVQHVEALDGWISRGGFLPKAWSVRR